MKAEDGHWKLKMASGGRKQRVDMENSAED